MPLGAPRSRVAAEVPAGLDWAKHPNLTYAGWDGSPSAAEHGIWSVAYPLREEGKLCARAVITTTGGPAILNVDWEIVIALRSTPHASDARP